ncbi:MAG: TlpA family protein disulfide reductase, partial [Gemmatimonadota bacterium]|nr:TlpA family protein disulfide reductase [Gemmatimonadota bacterium]
RPPRRRSTWEARTWAVASGLILASCLPGDHAGLDFGDPLPAFSATHMDDGNPVELTDYRGRVLLLNLWATWCVPCRTETPYLQSLYEEYEKDGLEVVGVSVDRAGAREEVRAFAQEMGVTYDILLDPQGRAETTFRARGLPNSILVGRDGAVIFSWLGPVEEGDPTFLAGLREALRTPQGG